MDLQKRKFEYKWVILASCFLMTFFALGFCSGNKGLYLSAITEALHIPRSLFSINDSFRYVSSALINLFFGTLLYKYGIRKMVAFGFISLAASMFLYSVASNILMFYLGGILLGVGLTFTTGTMTSSIIRRWFKKDIGKYTGIVYAANGIGGALAAQIVSPMINDPNNIFGYRNAYRLMALILIIVGTIIVICLRERPKDDKVEVVELKTKKRRGSGWVGIEYKQAIRRPAFYLAGLVVFLTGFMLQGINTVYAAHLKDSGLDPAYVATIASIFSLTLTFTKILVGAMYDRFGLKVVMMVCQLAGVVAFVAMIFIHSSMTGMVLAVIFALLYALSLPLETLVIPLIINDLFGNASFDKIMGIFIAMNYTGYALGAPIINLCFDKLGSYKPAFIIYSALMLITCIGFRFVINSAHRDKEKIIAQQTAVE